MAAALGLLLSACGGGPAALSLSSSGRLGGVVQGRAGSATWCRGVEATEASLRGAAQAQGASFGVVAHVVRRDEGRLASALEGFRGAASAPARQELEVALTTAGQAYGELRSRRLGGQSDAGTAAVEIATALARLQGAKGSTC